MGGADVVKKQHDIQTTPPCMVVGLTRGYFLLQYSRLARRRRLEALRDIRARSVRAIHLPKILDQHLWRLIRSKVTSTVVSSVEDDVRRRFIPSGIKSASLTVKRRITYERGASKSSLGKSDSPSGTLL